MPPPECPHCSVPLIPDRYGDRCPNCGPIATRRSPPARWREDRDYDRYDDYDRRRDRYDDYDRRDDRYDDYEPRGRRYDDEDYPRRYGRREGVPWYAVLIASFMLGVAGLALLGHGAIFCVGFHAEFIRNAKPDPGGLIALAFLAAAICASVVALVAGYSMIVGRRFWLGIVGCVAVTLCTHLFLLGLIVGIAGLVILLQPDVKESFR